MIFAYADPPYLGLSVKFYGDHPESHVYDTIDGHRVLVERLMREFPDGWVLHMHVPSLRIILPLLPETIRLCAWVKPFVSFKPGVNPAYAWEPIAIYGGRKRGRNELTIRDYVSCPIALRRGIKGAKPEGVVRWALEMLDAHPEDDIVDLFPGSGGVAKAIGMWRRQYQLPMATPDEYDGEEPRL